MQHSLCSVLDSLTRFASDSHRSSQSLGAYSRIANCSQLARTSVSLHNSPRRVIMRRLVVVVIILCVDSVEPLLLVPPTLSFHAELVTQVLNRHALPVMHLLLAAYSC